jgi:hypothetical protein
LSHDGAVNFIDEHDEVVVERIEEEWEVPREISRRTLESGSREQCRLKTDGSWKKEKPVR